MTLEDIAAPVDFVTAGVESGDLVVNLSDGSNSLVISVLTATRLSVSSPIGGAENDFDTGDQYVISPFVTRSYTAIQSGCNDDAAATNPPCEFDDLILWISPPVIMNRLVEARRLP